MPRLKVRIPNTGFTSRTEAESFAKELGADSFNWGYDARLKESSLDLSFENHYDGSRILESFDNCEGYLEFEDGTVSRHFVTRERRFDDD